MSKANNGLLDFGLNALQEVIICRVLSASEEEVFEMAASAYKGDSVETNQHLARPKSRALQNSMR
jgi:hypothetical protein